MSFSEQVILLVISLVANTFSVFAGGGADLIQLPDRTAQFALSILTTGLGVPGENLPLASLLSRQTVIPAVLLLGLWC